MNANKTANTCVRKIRLRHVSHVRHQSTPHACDTSYSSIDSLDLRDIQPTFQEVKCGEADAYPNRPLDPVHAQPLEQPPNALFFEHRLRDGEQKARKTGHGHEASQLEHHPLVLIYISNPCVAGQNHPRCDFVAIYRKCQPCGYTLNKSAGPAPRSRMNSSRDHQTKKTCSMSHRHRLEDVQSIAVV